MTKTCGECRFYVKETEHCKLKGIGWKFATDTPCSGFTPRKPITNGDKIRQMSNGQLADLLGCDCCSGHKYDWCNHIDCKQGKLDWLNAPAEREVESEETSIFQTEEKGKVE